MIMCKLGFHIMQGNGNAFNELVNQFDLSHLPPPAQLRLWITALSHVVSRLERPHSVLIEAIVNVPWSTTDTSLVKSLTVFVGMFLSARQEYLSLILSEVAHGSSSILLAQNDTSLMHVLDFCKAPSSWCVQTSDRDTQPTFGGA